MNQQANELTHRPQRMKPEPRSAVRQISSVHHGAADYAELETLGLTPDQVIDFSVNSNPFGPSPNIAAALSQVNFDRYPDREAIALRRALSDHHQVKREHILVGNGSAELLQLTALSFLEPGSRVVISGPTFGEYAKSATIMGAQVTEVKAIPEDNFQPDLAAIRKLLSKSAVSVLFLCSPNNPTGQIAAPDEIHSLAENYPATLIVVDEAYLPFARGLSSAMDPERANLLILRSMTKDYSLAGLRLGYAVAGRDLIQAVASVRPPWNVNAYAQAAGLAALEDQDHLRSSLQKTWLAKKDLILSLKKIGLSPAPSRTHFFLLPVDNAAEFRGQLMEKGLQVRDCSSFGLPSYVRIATLTPEKNRKLVDAISEIL